jgi:two-component system chemotaxis response regulator CheB
MTALRTPPRVLIVDDSVVIRRLLTTALTQDPGVEVVGTAANGRIGLDKIRQLKPDAVVLDLEMPVLDGLAALTELRATDKRTRVIVYSTLTSRGAQITLDALAAGADDYALKPSASDAATAVAAARADLLPKLTALTTPVRKPAGPPVLRTSPPLRSRPQLLAIGCSTGGPDALTQLLGAFPAMLPVPVVIAQHMPPLFTPLLAQRLDRVSALKVSEAQDGQPLSAGEVLVAPGDRHLEVVRTGGRLHARLTQAPPENYCRPSADVLLRSAAAACPSAVHALILTGMGSDGREGVRAVANSGGEVTVQDEATSVVWGMPGAVVAAGLAHTVLPLPEISGHLTKRLSAQPITRPSGAAR